MELTPQNIGMILVVLIIFIPQLIKSVEWIIRKVKEYKKSHKEAFEAGQEEAAEDNAIDARFQAGETKIEKLLCDEKNIQTSLDNINQHMAWLSESDNLNIKYVIKRSWEQSVVEGKPLDHYEYDLLEHRYSIYKLRGGNSWAEGMMKDIRAARRQNSALFQQNIEHR